jgi:hypothetical protein
MIKRSFFLLLLLLVLEKSHPQDSLRAREIDSLINANVSKYNSRTDIIGDTVTHYMYDYKTSEFSMVMESLRYSKNKATYKYHYYNGELIRASVYKQKFLKKNDYAVYYFSKTTLIRMESHGIATDKAAFILTRGLSFLKNSKERYNGPNMSKVSQ